MSGATFVEVSIVVEALTKSSGSRQLDAFMRRAGITIEPLTEEHVHLARQAFTDFGKGRHPAGLNYGDCFSYALAKATTEPLLFKGKDFAKTDLGRCPVTASGQAHGANFQFPLQGQERANREYRAAAESGAPARGECPQGR